MGIRIQPGVEERAQSPTAGEVVTLIVGVSDDEEDPVESGIEEIGGSVKERLPYDTLVVSIEETRLEELCEISGISTIELEGVWEPMGDINFPFPPGSNL